MTGGRLVGWLRDRARRHPRLLVFLSIGLILVGTLAARVETVRERAEARALRMPGELVDVGGGRRLHLDCRGAGGPVVVLIPGAGETSAAWGLIAPAVARLTRVCVYDRAGRGWSDPAPPQDGNELAEDLHAALASGGVKGPVVLVGHSFGGLSLRVFAARFPGQVAGAVLLDATHPEMFTRIGSYPVFYWVFSRVTRLFPALAHFGVVRWFNRSSFDSLPEASRRVQQALWATPRQARSQRDEWAMAPVVMAQAAELRSLGERPLIVLTAGRGTMEGWTPLQEELAALSTNTLHRVAGEADHAGLVGTRAGAAASTQAIADVVLAVRTGRPLR